MVSPTTLQIFRENREWRESNRSHGVVNLVNRGSSVVWIEVPNTKQLRVRRVDVWHFSRIVKSLVTSTYEPTILVHTHNIIVITIDDVFHWKLIAKLIRIGVTTWRVHTEGNSDERKPILGTIFISGIVRGSFSRFAIISIQCTHVCGVIILVVIAATRQLRRKFASMFVYFVVFVRIFGGWVHSQGIFFDKQWDVSLHFS
mmetsp:Transcript_28400/g.76934  ORF Transcript_28400/g.76934 Transcript_28400/m.76934 type:complete len:201 (+) Transcript_28400:2277-2879(+)